MPKIDVAIPCYQYGRFLRDCVRSIQSQNIDDLRILIIDNASTDDSVEVAEELARDDPRIEIVAHKNNLGPHASYNEAIDWASSDYFLLLDADDFLVDGCLARAIATMETNPNVAFTHGKIALLTPRTSEFSVDQVPTPTWDIMSGDSFLHRACKFATDMPSAPTVVRRTDAQKRAGYYRKELPYTDDIELWLRLAMQGDVAHTNALQAVRRIHASQATTSFRDEPVNDHKAHEDAFESFFAHEGRLLPNRGKLLELARRNMADHAYWSGLSHIIRGYRKEGMTLVRYASRNSWLGLRHPPLRYLTLHKSLRHRTREILAQFSLARREGPGSHERT
jgi:glycosyltransferase involved in cell wall biosynthesis